MRPCQRVAAILPPLLLVLLAAAGVAVEAAKCGPKAGNAKCAGNQCCSIYGFCGTSNSYCGKGKCFSGACKGQTPAPSPGGPSGKKVQLVVQEGGTAVAKCAVAGHTILTITAASYGSRPSCYAKTSPSVIKQSCLKKKTCSVLASNKLFGDPCKNKPKRLKFTYTCGKSVTAAGVKKWLVVSAKQGKPAIARCGRGRVITGILDPLYGAPLRNCNSTRSYSVVARTCLGRDHCMVHARNNDFQGDPCPKFLKKVTFKFSCAKETPKPNPKPSPKPKSPKPKPSPKPKSPVIPQDGDLQFSFLWGRAGELWRPTGRLADHSYAGYMANERGIPNYDNQQFNVRAFGAQGNDVDDDTTAFEKAIQAASDAAAKFDQGNGKGFLNGGSQGVAVVVPAGTYRITRSLSIAQSNVVLRGEGADQTVLYFPKSLQAIYGKEIEYATGGAFLNIDGWSPSSGTESMQLTAVTAGARRGDRRIEVGSTRDIEVGMWIRIFALEMYRGPGRRRELLTEGGAGLDGGGGSSGRHLHAAAGAANKTAAGFAVGQFLPLTPALQRAADMAEEMKEYRPLTPTLRRAAALAAQLKLVEQRESQDTGVQTAAAPGSLDAYLYGDMPNIDSGRNMYDKADHIRFVSRVTAVGDGWIQLERPLNYDLRLHWKPYVYKYEPRVQHSGFEGFTVKFIHDVYPQHLVAYGYNAFALTMAANCWIRNVKVINADNGVQVVRSDFVTVQGIQLSCEKKRWTASTEPDNGHHGLWGIGAVNVLFTGFNVIDRYMHDLTFAIFSENLVFANGRGSNLNIDMHRGGSHNNLISNVDVGSGERAFQSGGHKTRGAYSAANNTWWNVMPASERPTELPFCEYGPMLNFVGKYTAPQSGDSGNGAERRRRSLLLAPGGTAGRGVPVPTSAASSQEDLVQTAAYKLFPGWCQSTDWWVETLRPGADLYPKDLHAAMIATRRFRLR